MLQDSLSTALFKSALAVFGVIFLGLLIAFVPTPFSERAARKDKRRRKTDPPSDKSGDLGKKKPTVEELTIALRDAEIRAKTAELDQARTEAILAQREKWCARVGEPCRVAEIAEKEKRHEQN